MNTIDDIGALCWCLMSVVFVAAGARFALLNAGCAFLVALVFTVCAFDARGLRDANAVALVVGLILYWVGLLFLRAMLDRSVSLHLLICCASNEEDPSIDERIAGRLDEAMRYRLVSPHAGMFTLTRSGAALSRMVASLYLMLRIH